MWYAYYDDGHSQSTMPKRIYLDIFAMLLFRFSFRIEVSSRKKRMPLQLFLFDIDCCFPWFSGRCTLRVRVSSTDRPHFTRLNFILLVACLDSDDTLTVNWWAIKRRRFPLHAHFFFHIAAENHCIKLRESNKKKLSTVVIASDDEENDAKKDVISIFVQTKTFAIIGFELYPFGEINELE